jgi:hypothetical protein
MRQVFIRVYKLEIQTVMLVFSTQLCELYASLTFSLVHIPHPSLCQSTVYKDNVWLGGRRGVLSCVGDHILQELNTLYLTRFRTYKIARPPQKNQGGEVGLRQINTCRKVPLLVNFLDVDILHCFLSV